MKPNKTNQQTLIEILFKTDFSTSSSDLEVKKFFMNNAIVYTLKLFF
jgi:hypothetical protein